MSAAFDNVDHKLLLSKLEHYGISNKELKLMSSFLSGCSQYVEIYGIRSDILPSIECLFIQESKLSVYYTLYMLMRYH